MIIPPGTVTVSQDKNGKTHTTTVQNKIFSAPNLLSLLNIPEEINRFGSPRLIWEMDHCGEGFLPQILPLIVNLNPNSISKALNTFFEQKCFRMLINGIGKNSNSCASFEKECSSIRLEKTDEPLTLTKAAKKVFEDSSSDQPSGLGGQLKINLLSQTQDVQFEPFFIQPTSSAPVDNDHNEIPVISNCKFKKLKQNMNEFTPCVIHVPSGKILVLHCSGDNKHSTIEVVEIDLHQDDVDRITRSFDAIYFQICQINKITTSEDLLQLDRKDMLCGFLLQHANKKSFYYVIRMDWTELTYDLSKAPNLVKTAFTHPISNMILNMHY